MKYLAVEASELESRAGRLRLPRSGDCRVAGDLDQSHKRRAR